MAMPIRFDKTKKYVIIAHEIRIPYYKECKRRFSLNIDILTLSELESIFSSKRQDKNRFIDKEIIISGYYHEGDKIAHYLNSLSSNMSIGYELEEMSKPKKVITFKTFLEERNECIKMMDSYKNKGDVYLFNLSENDFILPSCVKICNDLVPPLSGNVFVLGYKNQEDGDIKRIVKSPRTVFVSASLEQ